MNRSFPLALTMMLSWKQLISLLHSFIFKVCFQGWFILIELPWYLYVSKHSCILVSDFGDQIIFSSQSFSLASKYLDVHWIDNPKILYRLLHAAKLYCSLVQHTSKLISCLRQANICSYGQNSIFWILDKILFWGWVQIRITGDFILRHHKVLQENYNEATDRTLYLPVLSQQICWRTLTATDFISLVSHLIVTKDLAYYEQNKVWFSGMKKIPPSMLLLFKK